VVEPVVEPAEPVVEPAERPAAHPVPGPAGGLPAAFDRTARPAVRLGARPAWSRTGPAAWPELLAACCDGVLSRLVLGPASVPLDAGRATRQWSAAQRRAITVRDRHCVWPGCRRPAGWCEIDHIIPWQAGGPTDVANGRLLCRYHHQLRHDGWTLTGSTAAGWRAHPPDDWADRLRRRRKHRRDHPIAA